MPDALPETPISSARSGHSGDIFVDLDGTLVRTDVFAESILKLIKQNPINILKLIGWSLKGRSVLKMLVARKIKPDPRFLPYEAEIGRAHV